VRLALRDLSRYRARSGSALAAISLGVLIAVIIAIASAARYANALDYAGPNLASNQLDVYAPGGQRPPGIGAPVSAGQLSAMRNSVGAIAASLGSHQVVELEMADASLEHAASGRGWNGPIYVATPQLLRTFGIRPSQVDPSADILTMRPGIAGLSKMQLLYGVPGPGTEVAPGGGRGLGAGQGSGAQASFPCPPGTCLAEPTIQEVRALPSGTSAPNTVITEHVVHQLGLQTSVSGWLIETSRPPTAAQLGSARLEAAAAGMAIETKNDEPSSAQVINWATAFGVLLALGILAMSVGLIRSETASDLSTLAATGASSRTRRTLTAVTAGALGFLGALLGTVAGYIGVIGWLRDNSLNGGISALGHVPVGNLAVILVGMPLAAALVGWLVAGRERSGMARQPLV
ncbi:MAG: FtsX-like permease family protein, partial [Acidimicrobiales bacterium]